MSTRPTIEYRSSHFSLKLAPIVFLACACSDSDVPVESEQTASAAQRLTTTYSVSFQDGVDGYVGTTDAHISQNRATTSYGASTTLYVDGDDPSGTGRDSSTLIRWDVSAIPIGATVTGASITLYVTNSSSGAYPIYGLKRAFSEASVTWNLAASGVNWTTSGAMSNADRDTTELGTFNGASTGSRTSSLNASGIAEVQAWVDAPTANFGLILASSSITDGLDVRSSEHSTASSRPKLSVNYTMTTPDGAGGTTSTGGTASTGGTISTGGTSVATGGAGSAGSTSFGFFVFSDMHATSASGLFNTAVSQMKVIDPAPIAGIGTGDFTDNASATQWTYNTQSARQLFDPNATSFGTPPRYLGAAGNHDISSSGWYTRWASNLPGQTNLGHSGTDGIYFSTTYRNVLFAVMDSNMTSGTTTSWSDAQSVALTSTLANSDAQFKFMFFHKPVYSCSTSHAGYAPAMPWLDLAETHDVDAIFSGHTHVYTRTCRMKRAACTGNASGTVLVEVGSVGSSGGRAIDVSSATVTGTNASGASRSDTYNCNSGIYSAKRGNTNDFCYVHIDGCRATIRCFVVGAGNTTPFDTWTIDHC